MDSAADSTTWPGWLASRGPRFLLFARSQTRCEADAQDILQDALVEAWRRSGNDGGPPDDALVFTTIRRRAIDLGRSSQRRKRREQSTPWFDPAPAHHGDVDQELARAVQELPDHLREVVAMKIWGELTFQQIGDALGVSINTAASRYRYAIERLRAIFQEAAL